MSPLTKLFVVMLVVLSLLTTAGTIVYVNKEDIQKTTLSNTQAQLQAAERARQAAQEQLGAANANVGALTEQKNAQSAVTQKTMIDLQNEASKLRGDVVQATSAVNTEKLNTARLTEAVNASQATTNKLQEEVARLRTANDTLVRQTADLNSTVSDLTNRLDVTERQRRLLAEQLTQTQGENQRLGAIISGAKLSPQQQELAVNRSGLPNINGVVRDVRTIAGNQYATISVGSADQVARGMEFKILDRANGNFLGTLVVDSVEPNESTGRLFGPRISEIKPGVTVQTSL